MCDDKFVDAGVARDETGDVETGRHDKASRRSTVEG